MRVVARCSAIWLLSMGIAHAEDDAAILVSGSIGGRNGHPRLALNTTDNQYIVVWGDLLAHKLYARVMSAAGTFATGPKLLTNMSVGTHYGVAFNSTANEYLVVWESYGTGLSSQSIFVQRLKKDGKPVGSALKLAGEAKKLNWMPDIVYNALDDVYLVVWSKEGLLTKDGGNYSDTTDGLYTRFLDGDAKPIGSEALLAKMAYQTVDGYLMHLGFQGFHIRWQAHNDHYAVLTNHIISTSKAKSQDIEFYYLKDDGSLAGNKVKVNQTTVGARSSATCFAENITTHQWLSGWDDIEKKERVEGRVTSRLLGTGGNPAAKPTSVFYNGYAAGTPVTAFDIDKGHFLMVYEGQQNPEEETNFDLFGQFMTGTGALSGKSIVIASANTHDAEADVIYNAVAKNYLVVYSQIVDKDSYKVYGTFVTPQ